MMRYANRTGRSNVSSYEIGEDYIKVKFKGNVCVYTYSHRRAGVRHVENLKILAQRGYGLNSYIKRKVNSLYDRKKVCTIA